MSKGVIYIATGERYISRAVVSVTTLKAVMPNIHVTIFCDQQVNNPCFDQVILIDKPLHDFADKITYIPQSPYEETLFIDADTYLCDEICDVFALLDYYDIAVAHDTYRLYVEDYEKLEEHINKIPETFPMLNTGVILFRKSDEMSRFFAKWAEIHTRNLQFAKRGGTDQPAFREALYGSNLRLAVLPPEYNCRFVSPVFINTKVKILHGPHRDLASVEREINKRVGNRVFLPAFGTIRDQNSLILFSSWYLTNLKSRLLRSLQSRWQQIKSS